MSFGVSANAIELYITLGLMLFSYPKSCTNTENVEIEKTNLYYMKLLLFDNHNNC